jgi:hypothetical protein
MFKNLFISGITLGVVMLVLWFLPLQEIFTTVYAILPNLLGLLAGLLGLLAGIVIFLFVLPLIPTAIERLSNKPNRFRGESKVADYPVSPFGFFTSLARGLLKIKEASGGRFITCIMNHPGHTYAGLIDTTINPESADYWKVIKTPPGKKDAHPLPLPTGDVSLLNLIPVFLVWFWARWVYMITGYVFIGVYPYRRIRTYTLKRYKKGYGGAIEEIEDYSDHFRVANFTLPIFVPEADTSDQLQVGVTLDLILYVSNPVVVAYQIDDWAPRMVSSATACITEFVSSLTQEEITKRGKTGRHTMAQAISDLLDHINTDGAGNTIQTGIVTEQILVIDVSPVETVSEVKRRLAAVPFARVAADAEKILAVGVAAKLAEQIKAVRADPEIGLAVLAVEGNVRAAKEAGNGAIISIGSNTNELFQPAILKELRKANQGNPEKGKENE